MCKLRLWMVKERKCYYTPKDNYDALRKRPGGFHKDRRRDVDEAVYAGDVENFIKEGEGDDRKE